MVEDNSDHSEQHGRGDDDADNAATASSTTAGAQQQIVMQQVDADEEECIRLAREDLQAKLRATRSTPGHGGQPVQHDDDDDQDDPPLLVVLDDKKDQLQQMGSRELSAIIKMGKEENPPPFSLASAEMEEDDDGAIPAQQANDEGANPRTTTDGAILGAVTVNGTSSSSTSPRIQPLRPAHPNSLLNGSNSNGGPNDHDYHDLEQPSSSHHHSNEPEAAATHNGTQEPLLEATLVVEDSSSGNLLNNNNNNNNNNPHHHDDAKVISAEELVCGFSTKQWWYMGGCLAILMTVIVVTVALLLISSQGNNNKDDNTQSTSPQEDPISLLPTLEQIRLRDVLRCGVWKESYDFFHFAQIYSNESDQVDFVLCQAYAAAILGSASKHQIIFTTQQNNLVQLAEGKIDLLLSHVETGMQADIWEEPAKQGFTFSVPYVYTDFVYGGLPEFVACADNNMNARGNCSGLKICTNDKSVYFETIASKLPESHLVKRNDTLGIVLGFVQGRCNVIPSENSGIMEWGLELLAYRGPYVRGTVPFAKDVVTVATRQQDVEFSDFVNLILVGLMAAEQANITQDNAQEMNHSAILGEELVNAVEAVGNYEEVYQRGVAPVMKRTANGGWNLINNGTTGLMYALPLGKVRTNGPGPLPGGTLERIWKRPNRKLHCGIRLNRPGFADWENDENGNGDSEPRLVGMDVEYCTALAASALEGEAQAIEFVPINNETDGYQRLHAGEVDVLAGFTWNVINDYREPTTGVGYSYSQPYFYRPPQPPAQEEKEEDTSSLLSSNHSSNRSNDSSNNNRSSGGIAFEVNEANLALVTRQDDVQFSSFVYWTVAATFYASERGITTARANDMPDVYLFGDDYIKMFRDAIYFSGNYDEIYERNLGKLLPRRGSNAINPITEPGPQLYVPPGFF